MTPNRSSRFHIPFEYKIVLASLLAGLPGIVLTMFLLWYHEYSAKVLVTAGLVLGGCWLGGGMIAYHRILHPLRTVSNLLEALREGDYSMRARGARWYDSLGEVLLEVNSLSSILKQERMGAIESHALLQTVMDQIEVAVFTFDENNSLRQLNRYAESLLGQPHQRLIGKHAKEIGLDFILQKHESTFVTLSFPNRVGRWELRKATYREQGKPHTLFLLSDLTHELRQEERQAWERLVQVLRHEINNSLAPVQSLAESLASLIQRSPLPDEWHTDLSEGLDVIAQRSRSLNRFMSTYAKTSRLPAPSMAPFSIHPWIKSIALLEPNASVKIQPGPEVDLLGDKDQLEQLLINLIKNAMEASEDSNGAITIGWEQKNQLVEIHVTDSGPGISNQENLFVPFFTTKQEGTGLGLYISRQIAEAHHGSLVLRNREDASGCTATLRLPISDHTQAPVR